MLKLCLMQCVMSVKGLTYVKLLMLGNFSAPGRIEEQLVLSSRHFAWRESVPVLSTEVNNSYQLGCVGLGSGSGSGFEAYT